MAKNRESRGIFDVLDLAEKTEEKITKLENTPAAEPAVETAPVPAEIPNEVYEALPAAAETRSRRVQFMLKPSVNDRLESLVKSGRIKSKNDLINHLLETYLQNLS